MWYWECVWNHRDAVWAVSLSLRCLVFVVTAFLGWRLWGYRRVNGPLLTAFARFFLMNAAVMGWYALAGLEAVAWNSTYLLRFGFVAWICLAWAVWSLWRVVR